MHEGRRVRSGGAAHEHQLSTSVHAPTTCKHHQHASTACQGPYRQAGRAAPRPTLPVVGECHHCLLPAAGGDKERRLRHPASRHRLRAQPPAQQEVQDLACRGSTCSTAKHGLAQQNDTAQQSGHGGLHLSAQRKLPLPSGDRGVPARPPHSLGPSEQGQRQGPRQRAGGP